MNLAVSQLPLLLLLLLSAVQLINCQTEEEQEAQRNYEEARRQERLKWLTVTVPNKQNLRISCASKFDYPFTLLENDTSSIGAQIKRMWWVLPDRSLAMPGYNDGNRRIVGGGSEMMIARVTEHTHGLYHCAAEAELPENATITHVYYYKRGLNLYGADLYQGNQWEKYKGNLLTGSLSSGTFLALVAGWFLLQKSGILNRFSDNKVAVMESGSEMSTSSKVEAGSGSSLSSQEAVKVAESVA